MEVMVFSRDVIEVFVQGDMFVVRNAGNLVPHSRFCHGEMATNEAAALELGCVANGVHHVIVCGHSDCKAVNLLYSLREEQSSDPAGRKASPLRAWMSTHATSSLRKYLKMDEDGRGRSLIFETETFPHKLMAHIDSDRHLRPEDRLSQVNTLQQLENIASHDFVRTRLERGQLGLHALWFDVYTGEVYYFSRHSKRFVEINEESMADLLREVETL